MKKILGFVRDYFVGTDKAVFSISALFISLAIFVNYYHGLNHRITTLGEYGQFFSWWLVFVAAFSFAYAAKFFLGKKKFHADFRFFALLLIAPAIFAWKMSYNVQLDITEDAFDNAYWNQVIYWPFKLVVMTALLFIVWRIFDRDQPFYGTATKGFNAKPYLLMLLIMVPLIAAASTQPDFLAQYPKLKNISSLSGIEDNSLYIFFYELSYGSDFIGIELFFRGFLVLAFVRFAGKDAILPMALFYCTIHFGKPLGECISSFFGGLILGVVTYHTRAIWGGLMVHLGIAWLMEVGGLVGNGVY